MATAPRRLPKEYEEKARRLEAALDAYLQEMSALKKERKAIMKQFLLRVDEVKMNEARKRLASL